MLYYKVKAVADQCTVYDIKGKARVIFMDELFTQKEWYKIIGKKARCTQEFINYFKANYPDNGFSVHDFVDAVEVPKNKTYFFFGVRKAYSE